MNLSFETIGRPLWLISKDGKLRFSNPSADAFLVANQLNSLPELFDVCGGLAVIFEHVGLTGVFSTEVGDGVFCTGFELDEDALVLTIQPRAVTVNAAEDFEPLMLLGKLGGKLGHDFNNILGSIQGCVELVRSKVNQGAPKESFERPFKILDSALAKSVQLTDKIRGFVRHEAGESPLRESLTNAVALCSKADPAFSIQVPAAPPACRVAIASQQFEQLLVTLFSNAHESGPGTATLEFSADGDLITLTVKDGGGGFSEERLAAPFEPFVSTKPSGVGKGYGLGLAMAEAIVKRAGGEISVSNLDQGAAVKVQLKCLV